MNLATRVQNWVDGYLPLVANSDADTLRHCRLIVGFGFLGGFFGLIYTTFYIAIGHYHGSAIVAGCDAAFFSVPILLRHSRRHFSFHGHLLCAILTFGFSALAAVEGGIRGHAVTWLATVPFCAVLLIGVRASYFWCAVCILVTTLFSLLDLSGVALPFLYPAHWHTVVTMVGYVGLAVFLFLLAQIFERGRVEAQTKMDEAYRELSEATNQLVHANEDLGLANRKLKHMNREKNEFIGIAAHDLKNPLTAVMGYAEILSMQDDPTKQRNQLFAGKINDAAERMLRLVTDLLDANAIEQGAMGLKQSEVNLSNVVTLTILAQQLAAERKRITVNFPVMPPIFVFADSQAMTQIVENFLSNAIKYSPPGRSVTIKIVPHEGTITMEVHDEGPGLSADDQARLFQKFTRLTPQPTGDESSTGLGLSIVKRLAESMGGHVGCRSEVGKGSVFWVSMRGYCVEVAA